MVLWKHWKGSPIKIKVDWSKSFRPELKTTPEYLNSYIIAENDLKLAF